MATLQYSHRSAGQPKSLLHGLLALQYISPMNELAHKEHTPSSTCLLMKICTIIFPLLFRQVIFLRGISIIRIKTTQYTFN